MFANCFCCLLFVYYLSKEKSHLLAKLQDCEQRLHTLEQETDRVDETIFNKWERESRRSSRLLQRASFTGGCLTCFNTPRSQKLEDEATELRERIKHLNDMVFCQQRKVKAMIEEVRGSAEGEGGWHDRGGRWLCRLTHSSQVSGKVKVYMLTKEGKSVSNTGPPHTCSLWASTHVALRCCPLIPSSCYI